MFKLQLIIFYFIAFIAIICAIRAVFTKKIFYSVFYAFITFLVTGLLFIALELPYLGVVQISLGCVTMTVLFVFAITLISKKEEISSSIVHKPRTYFSIIGLFLLILLLAIYLKFGMFASDNISQTTNSVIPSTKAISVELFLSYGAPFVFSGLYFLAAILGLGVFLSKKKGGKK